MIAETTWLPADNYRPDPQPGTGYCTGLGYDRTGPWQPDEFEFACNVQP